MRQRQLPGYRFSQSSLDQSREKAMSRAAYAAEESTPVSQTQQQRWIVLCQQQLESDYQGRIKSRPRQNVLVWI
jgi:hypothetical protein